MPTCRLTYLVCDVADSFSISKITSIVISLSYVLSISFSREKIAHNFSPWTSYRTWQRDFTFYFTRVSNNKVILFVFHAVLLVEGKPRLLFFFSSLFSFFERLSRHDDPTRAYAHCHARLPRFLRLHLGRTCTHLFRKKKILT